MRIICLCVRAWPCRPPLPLCTQTYTFCWAPLHTYILCEWLPPLSLWFIAYSNQHFSKLVYWIEIQGVLLISNSCCSIKVLNIQKRYAFVNLVMSSFFVWCMGTSNRKIYFKNVHNSFHTKVLFTKVLCWTFVEKHESCCFNFD